MACSSPHLTLLRGTYAPRWSVCEARRDSAYSTGRDATPEQIRQVTDGFRGLREQIPGIVGLDHGVNDSPEGKNLGFTHVYQLTFADAAARDTYLPHPAHREFGRSLRELGVLDAFVVDYVPLP